MFFIAWQSDGESKLIYTPGVTSEAEAIQDGVQVKTYGQNGKPYQKYTFTTAEAETLTMERTK